MAHNKRTKERIEQIAEELAAIEEDKRRKTAAGKRKVGEKVIDEYEVHPDSGEMVKVRRNVRKYLTTLDQLEKRGQLPKELRLAFDSFAEAVAMSSGACIDDRDLRGSSNRGIADWQASGSGQYGPRDYSERARQGENLKLFIEAQIPLDMMRLANQLVWEETGISIERPTPLTEYGNKNGFNQEQQARSSGATMVIDICRIVHHALKSR
jgi:hypothetical protein